ncbi:MAG: methionyl aminopeptidase [Acidobacteriota bacterium]
MVKVGRNDPCPCGTGKKYKRCCGKIAAESRPRPSFLSPRVPVKTAEDIEGMRAAGKLAARVLHEACARVKVGTTTSEIDDWVLEMTLDADAYPAPLNYPHAHTDPRKPIIAPKAFPRSVCTSLNDVVCHGIPDDTVLKDGDLINVDVTCNLNGYHGDTSRSLLIGEVEDSTRRLAEITQECMDRAIARVRPGGMFWEIGDAIQELAEGEGYSVVEQFTGHGIGKGFHEPPAVLHYRDRSMRFPMQAGHIFTIEPMINAGTADVVIDDSDHWTARTVDGKLSAQFEHTILVTDEGHEVLTARPE